MLSNLFRGALRLGPCLPLLLMACRAASHAADSPEIPQNARLSEYGTGWDCQHGFREMRDNCVAIEVPAHAYLAGTQHVMELQPRVSPRRQLLRAGDRAGKRIRHGLRLRPRLAVQPRLSQCRQGCAKIAVPAHAYAVDSSYGSGWECERGYRQLHGACAQIQVPANAYLARAGDEWRCERGFRRVDAACAPIEVPANAYLTDAGTDWQCERGFIKEPSACVTVRVPANGVLSLSGTDWVCDGGFHREADACIAFQRR